jgi:hypothetical protein
MDFLIIKLKMRDYMYINEAYLIPECIARLMIEWRKTACYSGLIN